MADADPRLVLTEAQLACLRAARTKGTTKNIAIELGISPNTVTQHLKEARLRLGDVTRQAAVEAVYTWDHQPPQKMTSLSHGIVSGARPAIMDQPLAGLGVPEQGEPSVVREDRARFEIAPQTGKPSLYRLVQHWLGEFDSELKPSQRGKMIVRTALAFILITMIIIAVGESLNRTFHSFGY